MSNDRFRLIEDDLTGLFIKYQHRLDNPMPTGNEASIVLVEKYRSDPMFNAKVRNLVCGVMSTIEKHLD